MPVKTYQADSMQEALAQVKQELGPDAVIVATRTIKPSGLFSKPQIEITVDVDKKSNNQNILKQKEEENVLVHYSQIKKRNERYADMHDDSISEKVENVVEGSLRPLVKEIRALRGEIRTSEADSNILELKAQLEEIRNLVSHSSQTKNESKDFFYSVLSSADIDQGLIQSLVQKSKKSFIDKGYADADTTAKIDTLKEILSETMRVEPFLNKNQKKVIALVGPTGVGKTTTIAKLAATAALMHGKNVSLITLDAFRMGAYDQLKQFADLMHVPLYSARDTKSLKLALDKSKDSELIFIDTAGRSPAGDESVPNIYDYITPDKVDCYLVLSAATRQIELRKMIQRYRHLGVKGMIITKIDEAVALGALVNASLFSHVPIAYVTFGQRVPEDISEPSSHKLASDLIDRVIENTSFDSVHQKLSDYDADYIEHKEAN